MTIGFGDELVRLLHGLGASLLISAIGIALALIIGCFLGALRYSGLPIVTQLIAIYVNFFRCTPLIVHIFFLYFGLPEIGVKLSPFQTGWISLALWGGAYQVESFRAGFKAVPPQEIVAARALGMSALKSFRYVTLPLGVRVSVPAAATVTLTQFRSSAFMVAIGYAELTSVANKIVSETYAVLSVFGTAALMYLVVCMLMSYGARRLERSLSVPGMGALR